jgi:DNA invertase Pin-like site-specific DNA recombinase
MHRAAYIKMISELRKGDVIVVWRIDRLGRTIYDLIKIMVEYKEIGVEFWSISEGIGTSTKMGRLWYMLSSVFAENERGFDGTYPGRYGSSASQRQDRRAAKGTYSKVKRTCRLGCDSVLK